jgi:hypothetical protein
MTLRWIGIGILILFLVVVGVTFSGAVQAFICAYGWAPAFVDLLTLVPALFSVWFLVEGTWREQVKGSQPGVVGEVHRSFAAKVLEKASQLPVVIVVVFVVGLASKTILMSAALVAPIPCG